ncbi:MAG: hypothetical protein ACD_75C02566G0004, partial [uncultured bacterium]
MRVRHLRQLFRRKHSLRCVIQIIDQFPKLRRHSLYKLTHQERMAKLMRDRPVGLTPRMEVKLSQHSVHRRILRASHRLRRN